MAIRRCVSVVIAGLFFLPACGSTTYSQTRTVWKPYSVTDNKQQKDGVIVELGQPVIADPRQINRFPEAFFVIVQGCDSRGRLLYDGANPVMVRVSVARPGQLWQLMSLTNNTDHVLRLNQVAIRLFDPSGNQIEPLSKEGVSVRLINERDCPSSQQAVSRLQALKIFDRNIEIVPGTTATFWVPFSPPSVELSGVWKYSIFDVPVQVDQTGNPIRTTRFEIRTVATKVVDTYRREHPWASPVLIGSKEEDPAHPTTPAPPPPPAPGPPSAKPRPPAAPAPPPAPESPAPTTDSPAVLLIGVPMANIRGGGDTKSRIIKSLRMGTRLTVIGRENHWYRVRLEDGTEGWVAESVTSPVR